MWLETSHITHVCWPNHGHTIEESTKIEIPLKFTNHVLFQFFQLRTQGTKSFLPCPHEISATLHKPTFSISFFNFIAFFIPSPPQNLTESYLLYSKNFTLSLYSFKKPQHTLITFLPLNHIVSATKENKRSYRYLEALLKESHQENSN